MGEHASLVNAESGEVIVPQLELANTFWRRLRGLQFRAPLSPQQGLLMAPCRSIHTHWMRFAIDVAMLDRSGIVLAMHANVPPWRMLAGPHGTQAMVEARVGTLATSLSPGDRVLVVGSQPGIYLPGCGFVWTGDLTQAS